MKPRKTRRAGASETIGISLDAATKRTLDRLRAFFRAVRVLSV